MITNPFKCSWYKSNVVASMSPAKMNPDRCWMNIALHKLNNPHLDNKKWIFDCNIYGIRYVYTIPVNTLRKSFELNNIALITNAPERYSFYIDFRKGKLFSTISASDKTSFLELERFEGGSYLPLVIRF